SVLLQLATNQSPPRVQRPSFFVLTQYRRMSILTPVCINQLWAANCFEEEYWNLRRNSEKSSVSFRATSPDRESHRRFGKLLKVCGSLLRPFSNILKVSGLKAISGTSRPSLALIYQSSPKYSLGS